jgi:arsenate reductase (thioredoxin)
MGNKDGRTKVLFVCVGNACRSPMAEAIARVDASDVMEAFSAGLAPIGSVAGMTKQTLMKNGYWVEGLEPKSISPEAWEQADVVVNLSGRARDPAFRDCSKVQDWDIEDPFGEDIDVYQQVFEKIRLLVAQLAQQCRKENQKTAARSGERRARPRLCPSSPIFISLNEVNGGVAFNISEQGLGVWASAVLPDGSLHDIWIQFPGSQQWVEARGQVAWRSKSNQEAGLRFVGLTEQAHLHIRDWISLQASSENQNLRLGVAHSTRTEKTVLGSYARTSKRPDRKAVRLARARSNPGRPRRRWGTLIASGVMIALISLTFEWVMMRRDVQTEVAASVTQKAGVLNEVAPGPGAHSLVGRIPDAPALADVMDVRPSRVELSGQVPALARPSAAATRMVQSSPVKRASVPVSTKKLPLATAPVNTALAERVQPLPVGSVPTTLAKPDVKTEPPVISASNLPTDALQGELKEIKSPLPPAKQPANPANMMAAVAVVADPYPSLRIPDGGISKKPGQSASLQLGHLLSRVEPIYPEEAKLQGIQGTVRLHAVIDRQGAVENLQPLDGSPILAAAAMNAVRQWRYTETLLAGRSVETEEDVAITFRLSNSALPTN